MRIVAKDGEQTVRISPHADDIRRELEQAIAKGATAFLLLFDTPERGMEGVSAPNSHSLECGMVWRFWRTISEPDDE